MKNCKVKSHNRNGKKVKGHSRMMEKHEKKEYGTGEKKKRMVRSWDNWAKEMEH